MDPAAKQSRLDARQLMPANSGVRNQGKNRVAAYVLWFLLGLFGGHRFYMKKKGSAMAQLILTITFIGMIVNAIWWIVDAFLVHTWVKEHNRGLDDRLVSQMLAEQDPSAPNGSPRRDPGSVTRKKRRDLSISCRLTDVWVSTVFVRKGT
jgi:TM2 domain-containing membrane protein YozV